MHWMKGKVHLGQVTSSSIYYWHILKAYFNISGNTSIGFYMELPSNYIYNYFKRVCYIA